MMNCFWIRFCVSRRDYKGTLSNTGWRERKGFYKDMWAAAKRLVEEHGYFHHSHDNNSIMLNKLASDGALVMVDLTLVNPNTKGKG